MAQPSCTLTIIPLGAEFARRPVVRHIRENGE
jgi:hypothetical protein